MLVEQFLGSTALLCAPRFGQFQDPMLRFWRDAYYEANANIFYPQLWQQLRRASACPKPMALPASSVLQPHADVACASSASGSPTSTRPCSVAFVVALDMDHHWSQGQQPRTRRLLDAKVQSAKVHLVPSCGEVHLFVALSGRRGGARGAEEVGTFVGADPFVSVVPAAGGQLHGPALHAALAQHDWVLVDSGPDLELVFVAPLTEAQLESAWRGRDGNDQAAQLASSPLAGDRSDCALLLATPDVAVQRLVDRRAALPAAAVGHVRPDGPAFRCPSEPLALPTPPAVRVPVRVPRKGFVVAAFATDDHERAALSMALMLMGVLGLGVFWDETGRLLAMADLERMDARLLRAAAGQPSLPPALQAEMGRWTTKPRKSLLHVPWLMASRHLNRTFAQWATTLDDDGFICVVLRHPGEPHVLPELACPAGRRIHLDALSQSAFHRLHRWLTDSRMGGMRALTRREVDFVAAIGRGVAVAHQGNGPPWPV